MEGGLRGWTEGVDRGGAGGGDGRNGWGGGGGGGLGLFEMAWLSITTTCYQKSRKQDMEGNQPWSIRYF